MKKSGKRFASALLVLVLVFSLGAAALADGVGSDVAGHPEETALRAFIDKGYLLGYGDGTVGPDRTITRAEFAALINRVAGYRSKSADMAKYADVAEDAWYYDDLAIACEAGYLIGKSETEMDPQGTITAQEVDIVVARLAGMESTVTDTTPLRRAEIVAKLYDNLAAIEGKGLPTGEVYVLMNIPYDVFYAAENVSKTAEDKLNINFDAISSATNKVGNTGKAGGGFHSAATVEIAEDGTVTAVGGANGAHMEGVTWPVKADASVLSSLGSIEVTDSRKVTVGTLGRGQTSSTELEGAATLMEAPAYSYYFLNSAPAYYMELTLDGETPVFSAVKGEAVKLQALEVPVSTGTHWGDIQLDLSGALEAADLQINAMVLTAEDGTTGGMVHLYNIWAANSLGWFVKDIQGLDGKKLTNIRYYGNDKNGGYFVYDYPVELSLAKVFTGELKASFDDETTVTVTGLPEDVVNPVAKVYYTTGGRGATYEYLTPSYIDPADGDLESETVPVVDGKITLTEKPEDGKTYTVELASDNYILNAASALFGTAPAEDAGAQTDGAAGHGHGHGNH